MVAAGHNEKVQTAVKTTKFGISFEEYELARSVFKQNNIKSRWIALSYWIRHHQS